MKRSKFIFLIFDLLFIAIAFLFFIWLKPASLRMYLPQYIKPFLGFAFLWLVISFIGNKYDLTGKKKLAELLSPVFRIDFTILGITIILMYIFHRFSYSRMIVLGTILFSTVLEIFYVILYYFHKKIASKFDDPTTFSIKPRYVSPTEINAEEDREYILPKIENIHDSIYTNLKERYLTENIETFDFIDKNINLQRIRKDESFILHTHTFFNIRNVEPASHRLFINMHKINDVRRINRYLIQVNKNLKDGGCFIGNVQTIKETWKKYFNNYSVIFAVPLYSLNFLFRRIFPKIPVLKDLYFAISKGENRAISRAEVLGRLYFCGFKIIATTEINNKLHFIAVKIRQPSEDISPSYGPFIKLRRVGKDGETIFVYKFRTMHPYSEYLQKYIHDNYQLEESGKFKKDFRITGWGKLFRKMWIDELPQLLNLFRSELSIVGVRALSEHYFSLYPKDMQELRSKFKPGLVPPYYADMPSSFEEILESERKYLESKKKHPITTDISYFFKAWWNIIVRGARSK